MSPKKPTAGIILAAGSSTRFGRPKQIFQLQGKYLLEHVLDAALASRLDRLVLVLGSEHAEIIRALGPKLEQARLAVVLSDRYAEGQSMSLQAGLAAVSDRFASVMFLLGDQPMVDAKTIDHLLERFWSSDKNIGVPVYRGKSGTPALFSQKFYPQLFGIVGDVGARKIIADHPGQVLRIEINNPLCFMDIDTLEDLKNLELLLSTS